MTVATFLGLVPVMLGLLAAQPSAVQSVTRLVVQDEVIMRVRIQPHPVIQPVDWLERKGPKCIAAGAIRRGFLSSPEKVDLVLANRSRVRAEFDEDCPALDFYGDFYLESEDERVCAGRDAIHSRMGGSCTIERFKLLVPQFKR